MLTRWKKSVVFLFFVLSVILIVAGLAFRESPDEAFRRGLAAARSENWEEVADCSRILKKHVGFATHAHLLDGFNLKSRGRLKLALAEFSRANTNPETNEESYHQGGVVCYQLRQYGDCIKLLRQVLKWNPERLEAHQILAAAYYDIGAAGMAIGSLENVIRLNDQDFRPLYLKATILLESERFGDAALAFEKAAALAPEGADAADEICSEWGNCLIRLRRFDDALAAMHSARPWPDIQARRAQACYSLRRFDEALLFAEEALKASPNHLEAAIVAAQLYERSGELDRGIRLLEECEKRYPGNLLLHQRLADLLSVAGRVEDAQFHRSRVADIAELRGLLANAHEEVAIDAGNAMLRLKLAQLAEKLEEVDLARGWYQAAMGLSPDDREIQQQWHQFQTKYPQPIVTTDRPALPDAAGKLPAEF